MVNKRAFRFFLIWAIIVALVASVVISMKVITGNIINDEDVAIGAIYSVFLFLIGIVGTFVFLRKFRKQ